LRRGADILPTGGRVKFRSCNQPWFEMQLLHNGHFRTCCYYPNELQGQKLDIPSLWHGAYFKDLRRLIVGGNPVNSHCEHCDYIRYFDEPMFTQIPVSVSGERRRNWERALQHHRDGVVDIDTLPVKYYMQFGVACNLRCVMCNHPQRYIDGESSELSADRMLEMTSYLKVADSVHLIGGEPLLIPNAVRFMDGVLANPELWDLQYVMYTNALMLGDFIEKYRPLDRMVVTASIDSSGAGYEAIRKRSSWQTVTQNLERFAAFARAERKPEWAVHISTILMKSSLLGLPDLFSWCIENGFPTNIVNIGDLDGLRNDSEHIFRNPQLLNEVPGWEAALARSAQLLSTAGRKGEAHRIEQAIVELSAGMERQQKKLARAVALDASPGWRPLFAESGQGLVDRLMKFLYGRRQKDVNPAVDDKGIRFAPTHMTDHLATPYLELAPGKERWARVTHEWYGPLGDIEPQHCVVVIQDEQCFELEPDRVDVERGELLTVTQYLRVPPQVAKIRVRVTLPGMTEARLPDALRVEQLREPSLVSKSGLLKLFRLN
jgi:molybdenum cofactor biosynthesis enzyme MoaA